MFLHIHRGSEQNHLSLTKHAILSLIRKGKNRVDILISRNRQKTMSRIIHNQRKYVRVEEIFKKGLDGIEYYLLLRTITWTKDCLFHCNLSRFYLHQEFACALLRVSLLVAPAPPLTHSLLPRACVFHRMGLFCFFPLECHFLFRRSRSDKQRSMVVRK